MARTETQKLVEEIEAVTIGGGSGATLDVTCNARATTELLCIATEASASEFKIIDGPAKIYGVSITNISGTDVEVRLTDQTQLELVHFGHLVDDSTRTLNHGPNPITCFTDVTFRKTNGGTVQYTVFYL